jgi:plastocyanin
VTLDFWTQDSPLHLRDGVHTMIGHDLGLHEELAGAAAGGTSRVAVMFTAPMKPGTYDIYCDTCCGGRESPTMHGKIVVEA